MNFVESYTPEYVLRLQQDKTACDCQSCQQQPLLLTRYWQNQVRHSAQLSCDRAAQEILCNSNAFTLHQGEEVTTGETLLTPCQQAINQGCINLLVCSDADINILLYTLGIFISKVMPLKQPEHIQNIEQELRVMLQQGIMAQAFDQLPEIGNYKLTALRALSESNLDARLDPLTGMTLVLTLNELKVLSNDYLAQSLQELEQTLTQNPPGQIARDIWLNALLYQCYHHAFPGTDSADWALRFWQLCQSWFSINLLSALFLQHQLTLSEENIAALFAAWQRLPAGEPPLAEALLVGLSLIR